MKYFLIASLAILYAYNTYPIRNNELARRYGLNSYITRTPIWFKDPKNAETKPQRTEHKRQSKQHASSIKRKPKVSQKIVPSAKHRRNYNNQVHPFAH